MNSLEICAGAGGQALGLACAGFHHVALVENDKSACETLRYNRPEWNVLEEDLLTFDGSPYKGIDLLAGGVPCQPFSNAGQQMGKEDERDLFPEAIRLAEETQPKVIMLENVRGLLDKKFEEYRNYILARFNELGYVGEWHLVQAAGYGVAQLRPRSILVVMKPEIEPYFSWPTPFETKAPTVGEALADLMAEDGWENAKNWAREAKTIGPTIVGGSKKHGGADLGPTRAKKQWEALGVDGKGVANEPPQPGFEGMPRLTNQMVARLQGFPDSWHFCGKKTPAYRQIGNAFPPPVAEALGIQIKRAINASEKALKEEKIELKDSNKEEVLVKLGE